MNPFDFYEDLTNGKKNIMTEENEKFYNSFLVNRSLSYHKDSVLLANEMNRYHRAENRLQYDFFINTLRKRKRFSKWQKADTNSVVLAIRSYFDYSQEKALQALTLLSEQQIAYILQKVNKGGRDTR